MMGGWLVLMGTKIIRTTRISTIHSLHLLTHHLLTSNKNQTYTNIIWTRPKASKWSYSNSRTCSRPFSRRTSMSVRWRGAIWVGISSCRLVRCRIRIKWIGPRLSKLLTTISRTHVRRTPACQTSSNKIALRAYISRAKQNPYQPTNTSTSTRAKQISRCTREWSLRAGSSTCLR